MNFDSKEEWKSKIKRVIISEEEIKAESEKSRSSDRLHL